MLIAISEESEEHFHLIGAVLHVADIVEADDVVATELSEILRQAVIALCRQEVRDQSIALDEENLHLLLASELTRNGSDVVTLAAAGEAEAEHVVAAAHEVAGEEAGQHLARLLVEIVGTQPLESELGRQARVLEQTLDATREPCSCFDLRKVRLERALA